MLQYLELRTHWRNDPMLYVRQRFGITPTWQQAEILHAIIPEGSKVSVRSGHGIGKSSSAAWSIFWFLETRDFSKIPCTAPSSHQLRDVLWGELSKWRRKADLLSTARGDPPKYWLSRLFKLVSHSLYDPQAQEWGAFARTAHKENPEALQGFHAENLLFVLDEASGIPEEIFEAAEGALSTQGARVLMLGNPTRTSGTFYASHHQDRHSYTSLHFRSDESPLVDVGYRERLTRKWGEASNVVRVRADGEFPLQEEDVLIALELAEACLTRAKEHAVGTRKLGVDPARFGCFDDETEILTNAGWKFFAELTGQEEVLSLYGDEARWAPITALHRYPFDGELNYYESARINFAITDNHQLLVRRNPKSSQAYVLKRFDEMPEYFVVRRCNTWAGQSPEVMTFETQVRQPHGGYRFHRHKFAMHEWATFLGWFVSEGNVYQEKRAQGRLRIVLTQYPGAKRQAMEALLTRMGLVWRPCANGTQVEFTSQAIGQHLLEHCGHGAAQKRIPHYIKEGSTAIIEAFLEGHRAGDGGERSNGDGRTYRTSSRQLANDLHEVLAKIGRAGKLTFKQAAGTTGMFDGRLFTRESDLWTVYERLAHSRRAPGQWRDSDLQKKHITRKAYHGVVYCVSTPSQTIYVRRHGCPMWSGNSDRTVLILRQGHVIEQVQIASKQDTMATVGRIVHAVEQWQVDEVCVDVIGLGAGIVDRLLELQEAGILLCEVTPVNVAEGAPEPPHGEPRGRLLRDYLWLELARWLREEAPIFAAPDRDAMSDLAGELSSVRYKIDSNGRIVIESKDEMRKRLGHSPDLADALATTLSVPLRSAGSWAPW